MRINQNISPGAARDPDGLRGALDVEAIQVATGTEVRLARLFDGGSNAVVAAIDHGLYNGPRPGFEDLSAIVGRLAGADADPDRPRRRAAAWRRSSAAAAPRP